MTVPKYHHLIPRTYLKAWCHSNDSIYVIDKINNNKEVKNIKTNFGVTQFHSIVAGMTMCNNDDLLKIFDCLNGYEVIYNCEKITSLEKYNNYYFDFDNWLIKKDNDVITRKEKNILKNKIEQVKILDIEVLWESKYESKWRWLRETIEYNVLNSDLNEIHQFYKGLIMKSVIAFNWRGFQGNNNFNEIYQDISNCIELYSINIKKEDRIKRNLENADDEMKHNLILKKYREFLNDGGIIYDMARNYIKLLNITFYVANEESRFITSDNPSFTCKCLDNKIIHIMPVSPKVLICIGRDSERYNSYIINRLSDEQVSKINNIIIENSVERIIKI